MNVECAMPAAVSAIVSLTVDGPDRPDRPDRAARPVDLWEVWSQISDPRSPLGRRHRLPSILALVQAAVTSGARSFAAIVHWIAAAPHVASAELGHRVGSRADRVP